MKNHIVKQAEVGKIQGQVTLCIFLAHSPSYMDMDMTIRRNLIRCSYENIFKKLLKILDTGSWRFWELDNILLHNRQEKDTINVT